MSRFALALIHGVPTGFLVICTLFVCFIYLNRFEKIGGYSDGWGFVGRVVCASIAMVFVSAVGYLLLEAAVNWGLQQLGYELPDYEKRRTCSSCKPSTPGDYMFGLLLGGVLGAGSAIWLWTRLALRYALFRGEN